MEDKNPKGRSSRSNQRKSRSRSSFAMNVPTQKPTVSILGLVLSGKRRFRAFVRKLIIALPWILKEDLALKQQELQEKKQEERPHTQLQRQRTSKKGVSIEAKKLLIKEHAARTPKDIEELIGYLGHLYFFNQYPKKEHEQLIAKSTLFTFGPGRVILRQGHPIDSNSGLYCVVSGNLSIEVETVDPITLHKTSEVVKKLGPNDCFGEAAILFNDVRESTITSLTPVELIQVGKGDFDAILKDSLEKEWSKINDCMKQLTYYFGDWGDVEVRRCSIISSLKSFKSGDLILGDGVGKEKVAYFVMEGRCSVVQNILVEQKKNGKFKLIPHEKVEDGSQNTVEEIFMQTSIFTKGACFGVGENRYHRRYVAETDVICLIIPKYLLLAHKRFDGYRQYLESRLFSEQELFNSFIYLRDRLNYRQKIIEGCEGRSSKINKTTIWDVPYYYRVFAPQIGICKVPDNIIDNASNLELSDSDIQVHKKKRPTTNRSKQQH